MEPIHWLLLICLGWILIWGGFGAYVAVQKGRSETEGMVFGAILGPIGLLIIAMLPPHRPKVVIPPTVPYVHRPRKLLP